MKMHSSYSHGKAVVILVSVIALLGLGAGIAAYLYLNQAPPIKTATIKSTSIVGSKRPEFSMLDLEGESHSISQWDGQVLIVNFWATWCPPCRREIPAFIELQEKYESKGFTIVGVALDNKQAAIDFVDPMGINYPILVGETEGIVTTQAYGNQLSVLPYTVVVDRKGIIRHTITSEVTYEQAEKLITPLL